MVGNILVRFRLPDIFRGGIHGNASHHRNRMREILLRCLRQPISVISGFLRVQQPAQNLDDTPARRGQRRLRALPKPIDAHSLFRIAGLVGRSGMEGVPRRIEAGICDLGLEGERDRLGAALKT